MRMLHKKRFEKKKAATYRDNKELKCNIWEQDCDVNTAGQTRILQKKNIHFESYYKQQKIIPEHEWDNFITTLQTDLPITFRIVEHSLHKNFILSKMNEVIKKLDKNSAIIKRLDWYPGYAYEIHVSRAELRSLETLSDFHRFLINESEAGTIFRQETVSMVPALFIPVHAGDYILDMCAAPGSKTAQLLEMLHSCGNQGAIVANDACSKRGHMLIHRLRHLDSPGLLVTNHNAQFFPKLIFPYDNNKNSRVDSNNKFCFDAILCDVPCTGDGTFRKSKNMWRDWDSGRALSLHRLQLSILRRAIDLCKVGGTIVYSTCSLNPLENEAVVGAAIFNTNGSLELQDVSDQLISLKRSQGLKTWSVLWKGKWMNSYEDCKEKTSTIVPSMFPLSSDISSVPLQRCLRFYPHVANTGGFFIAVLKKIKESPWISMNNIPRNISPHNCDSYELQKDIKEENKSESFLEEFEEALSRENYNINDDSTKPVPTKIETVIDSELSHCTWSKLPSSQTDFISCAKLDHLHNNDFWGRLGGDFGFSTPNILQWNQLFVKYESADNPKRVWCCSPEVAMVANALSNTPLKVLCIGFILFEGRKGSYYRIPSSGASWLASNGLTRKGLKHLKSSRVAQVSSKTLCQLLHQKNIHSGHDAYRHRIEDITDSISREALLELIPESPCLLIQNFNEDREITIPVCIWRGKTNVEILIDESSRTALLNLLLNYI